MKILKTLVLGGLLLLGALPLGAQSTNCGTVAISVLFGDTDIECQGDGVDDRIVFRVTPGGLPVGYVVVDEDNIIHYIGTVGNINFDVLPTGTLRVYGFAYNAAITGQVGQNLDEAVLANFCYSLTTNFITVNSGNPDGGSVSTTDGATEVTLCVGDAIPDVVDFNTTSTNPNYVYLITDENNEILDISTGSADFDGAPFGICRVWGLAYAGDLLAAPGQNAATATLASECFALSENFITVNRIFPDAGLVSLEDGGNAFTSCTSDEPTATVTVTADNFEPSADYLFVAVSAETNEILAFLDGNTIGLDALPLGDTYLYGISYTGNLVVGVGDSFVGGPLSDDCDDRSDTFVTVTKRIIDAGAVALEDGSEQATVCVGDGAPDELTFTNTYAGPDNFVYLVTDEDNVLLNIVDGSVIDFEPAPPGNCRVWGLAYSGELTIAPNDDVDTAPMLSDECFDLSENFVLINRNGPEGGVITLADGSTSFISCTTTEPTMGAVELVVTGQDPNLAYTFIIVDRATGEIVAIQDEPTVDLVTLAVGRYYAYGLSYLGDLLVAPGDIFTDAVFTDICFDLTDIPVTIAKRVQDAGELSFADGATEAFICPNDGESDFFTLSNTYDGPDNFVYLITDPTGVVQQFTLGANYDFDNDGPDTVRVYGLVYSGNFLVQPGLNILSGQALSSECFDLTDNFLTVVRTGPDGGNITFEDGSDSVDICVGDGVPNPLGFFTDGGGNNFIWVVTDEHDAILTFGELNEIDFEGAEGGICHVWALAFNGDLQLAIGDTITAVQEPASDCFSLSDNFLTVNRTFVNGGTVNLTGGATSAFTCSNDGEPDFFTFENTSTATDAEYRYIVTDENNLIIAVLMGNSVDLEEAAPGNCRIWGVSFTGNLLAEMGDDAAAVALSDGCFTLSSNFIAIRREEAIGGEVSLANGATTANICPGDDMADLLPFQTTGASTDAYTYVITDTDNNIIGFAPDGQFDFNDIAAPSTVRVWGIAYSGNISAQPTDNAATTPLSSECFALSDNFITVIREVPDAGAVSTDDGRTTINLCTDDGLADLVNFAATGASNTPYAYLITDEMNNVMSVIADGNSFDFEGAENGVCRVWGVAYTGTLTPDLVDQNAAEVALSDDCFDLSENFVTVIRGELNAGTVISTSGSDIRYTCPGDLDSDVITVQSVGAGTTPIVFVVTDDDNVVYEILADNSFDFEGLDAGEYRIWGITYTGSLDVVSGQQLIGSVLATGCADLTDNFVTVINSVPDAGMIMTSEGETEVNICTGDGMADLIEFVVTGASQAGYLYLVTEEDGSLVGALSENFLDFDNAATGTWRVYGLSYTGSVVVLPGANIFDDPLASGCYEITSNFIEVSKEQVDGGDLFTEDLRQTVYLCPEGNLDPIAFVNSSVAAEANYQYVLTTPDNFVLALMPNNTFDFAPVVGDFDELRLWGVSYTGNLLLSVGQNAAEVPLSDACFDLSDNFIDIYIDDPDGGTLTAANEADSVRLCHSNFMPGITLNTSTSSLLGYAYIVTDTFNVVQGISEDADGFVDFTPYEPGFYRVWGLSYAGSLSLEPGDTATVVMPATDCFEFSSNYVFVERTESLNAGEISDASGADTIYVCPGDGNSDLVILSNNSDDEQYRYFITDENNNISIADIENNVINFDPAMPGTVRIWGIAYTGEIDLNFNENALTGTLSTDCWALSNNFITVVVQTPEGGQITTDEGETLVTLVVDDGMPDSLGFATAGAAAGTPYLYVITDEENVILGATETAGFDFEGAGSGVCRVWGLSYTGNLLANLGDDADEVMLSDDCYDLSDNFIEVIRIAGRPAPQWQASAGTGGVAVDLALWPNPVNEVLTIEVRTPDSWSADYQELALFDLNGRRLQTRRLDPRHGVQRLDWSVVELRAGMYILRWTDGRQTHVIRFVKQ